MDGSFHSRLRLPLAFLLVMLAGAGCGGGSERQASPQTAEPAPAPAVVSAEDRGQRKPDDTAAPSTDPHAFSNIDSGEAERAASKRGHESAGEPAPAPAPGSRG
jgi:hypothetical protein